MKKILNAAEFQSTLEKIAERIIDDAGGVGLLSKVRLVGIRTRGATLAKRLRAIIEQKSGTTIQFGILDITFYRDDLTHVAEDARMNRNEIEGSIDNQRIYLVDDVLYTGRTIRCALAALFEYGRPTLVKLVVMADRNGREIPIQADIAGLFYDTQADDNIKVKLTENDGEDGVSVIKIKD